MERPYSLYLGTLATASTPEEKALSIQWLRDYTGQDFGDNWSEWSEWLLEHPWGIKTEEIYKRVEAKLPEIIEKYREAERKAAQGG